MATRGVTRPIGKQVSQGGNNYEANRVVMAAGVETYYADPVTKMPCKYLAQFINETAAAITVKFRVENQPDFSASRTITIPQGAGEGLPIMVVPIVEMEVTGGVGQIFRYMFVTE